MVRNANLNDVMVVDNNEDNIREFMQYSVNAKIADCTKREALESLGVRNFDICFVCIGSNFQASLEITDQLKELGAKKVVSKASTDIHAKFLSGDATEYRGDHRVSLVICNGLAGGRFLKSTPRMKALLETVDANLLPGGRALLANSFHQGFRKSTEDFMQIAAEAGWKVDGDWRCLALARNSEK